MVLGKDDEIVAPRAARMNAVGMGALRKSRNDAAKVEASQILLHNITVA